MGRSLGEAGDVVKPGPYLLVNAGVLRNMLTLQGNAIKDWARCLFAFGGRWLALPFLRRQVPRFLAGAVWSGIAYIGLVGCTAIIDEVRGYGVLVPVVLTPAVYAIAKSFGGAKSTPAGGWNEFVTQRSSLCSACEVSA